MLDQALAVLAAGEKRTVVCGVQARDSESGLVGQLLSCGLRSAITVPLISRGEVQGTLSLYSTLEDAYGHRECAILERLAPFIASAVENTRLYQQAEARAREIEVVGEVAKIITSSLDIGQVYEQFASQVKRLVDFDRATIVTLDESWSAVRIAYLSGETGSHLKAGDGLPFKGSANERVALTRRTLIIDDLTRDSTFSATQHLLDDGLRSEILVPLIFRERVVGAFALFSREIARYSRPQQSIVERLATQIGPAVENARLYREATGRARELEVVGEVARIITSSLDIGQVYEQFASQVGRLVDFDRAGINIIDHEERTFSVAYLSKWDGSFGQGENLPLDGSATGLVADGKSTLVIADLEDYLGFWTTRSLMRDGLRSRIMVPLMSKEKVIGTFGLSSRHLNAYQNREQELLERLATQIAPAVVNAQMFREVKQLALALENIGEAVSFTDSESRIRFTNRAFQEVYGYSTEEAKGEPAALLTPSDPESQAHTEEVSRTIGQGSRWRGEVKRVKKTGEVLYVNLTVTPVLDREESVIGYVGVSQDITERKRDEESLLRLGAILQATTDFVGMADADGRVLYMNRAGRRMVGLGEEEEISNVRIDDHHPEWAMEIIAREGLPTATREGLWKGEAAFRDLDGNEIPTSMVIIAHKSPKGEVEFFSTISRDITQRIRAEDALKQSEARNQAFLNALPDALFRVRRDGTYLDFKRSDSWSYAAPAQLTGSNCLESQEE